MYNLKDSDTTNVVSFNEKISEKVYRRSKGILKLFWKKVLYKIIFTRKSMYERRSFICYFRSH